MAKKDPKKYTEKLKTGLSFDDILKLAAKDADKNRPPKPKKKK